LPHRKGIMKMHADPKRPMKRTGGNRGLPIAKVNGHKITSIKLRSCSTGRYICNSRSWMEMKASLAFNRGKRPFVLSLQIIKEGERFHASRFDSRNNYSQMSHRWVNSMRNTKRTHEHALLAIREWFLFTFNSCSIYFEKYRNCQSIPFQVIKMHLFSIEKLKNRLLLIPTDHCCTCIISIA